MSKCRQFLKKRELTYFFQLSNFCYPLVGRKFISMTNHQSSPSVRSKVTISCDFLQNIKFSAVPNVWNGTCYRTEPFFFIKSIFIYDLFYAQPLGSIEICERWVMNFLCRDEWYINLFLDADNNEVCIKNNNIFRCFFYIIIFDLFRKLIRIIDNLIKFVKVHLFTSSEKFYQKKKFVIS